MIHRVKDKVEETLKQLAKDNIPVARVPIGEIYRNKLLIKAKIGENKKRISYIQFYMLYNIEEYTGSYEELVAAYKHTQNYLNNVWLKEGWTAYAYVHFDRFEISVYENNQHTHRTPVLIEGFTGNCGVRTWTGIPLGLNVDEWKFVNEFLRLTYPRIGLFLASHNTGTINNYLQPMLESGWKQTEPVYNPNSTNNIAVLMLAINQPVTIK